MPLFSNSAINVFFGIIYDNPEGEISLSIDGYNGTNFVINNISLVTDSEDWDLYLCKDDGFNIADISSIKLVSNGTGNMSISSYLPYLPIDGEIYFYFDDLGGTNTCTIYVDGVYS